MSNNLLNNTTSLQNILEALQTKAIPGGVDTTDATATSSDILSGKTAYAGGQKITGTIAFAPATIITPTTTTQTAISSGYYASGNITVAGDSNLVAENIKKGTSIFGVNGSYEGSGGAGEADYSAEDGLITKEIAIYTNDRVTKIGASAFAFCNNLTSVNFPTCTSIGSGAFWYCTNLTSVNFPLCLRIESSAFTNCENLTSVNFPVCSSIGNNAFVRCSNLTSVSFPVCSYIGGFAFSNCLQLTSICFPLCSHIGGSAFTNCSNLNSVNFPVCSSIGGYAFVRCSQLTSADFGGNSVISTCVIHSYAFSQCSKLSNLTLRYSFVATLSHINAFTSTPMSLSTYTGSFGSIYVPGSLIESYKIATNWATYANRFVALKYIGLMQSNFTKNIYYDQTIELNNCFAYTGYDTIPTITVSYINNLLTDISLAFDDYGIGTITAVSTGIVGTEIINISYIDPDTNEQKTVSIELEMYSEELMSYAVTRVNGTQASYDFVKNSNGFYESNNKGDVANNSYVLCQVSVTNPGSTAKELIIEYINFAESTSDYGIFYELDLATAPAYSSAGSNIYKTCRGESVADIKTLTYTIPEGTHTFYVKYLKDSSISRNNDSLQFRLVNCQEIL